MAERAAHSIEAHDSGFGMLEIMVSMLLLGLLAIGFLPLLMQSARVSASNATLATATQLVSQEMALLRGDDTWSCAELKKHKSVDAAPPLAVEIEGISDLVCNTPSAPRIQKIRVWVHERAKVKSISEASTLIYLTA
ncbi:type II secretion system protein [Cryobacterium sp. PH31-O1]|uniref:type IV pilus modification PilV family protein n=1 Tax=Cryobacterium sp. PH31-O1 TaxID=3046306 RepID=UPI0024BBC7DF|nr:type II secretion system protein [Cryobacterium sp. PH31-O1]MDJ0337784.1 type II secretion system protein [Cryobacterium sp. PH31-O1]